MESFSDLKWITIQRGQQIPYISTLLQRNNKRIQPCLFYHVSFSAFLLETHKPELLTWFS